MKTSMRRLSALAGVLAAMVLTVGVAAPAEAQYFGRNKVQYGKFKFTVLVTPHFDIYYYPEEAEAAKQAARMAERWYTRLSQLLGHTLTGRQPVVLYASHPDFEQTNVIEGLLNEGTGGVTEGAKRRVIMPMAATLADTDHVLGHELVHAFQYDILGIRGGGLPLWFIEGMAEYLSIGARDAQTAMWLRDSAIEDRLPALDDLDHPRYFPYRFGHAFWAYIGGRYGDNTIGQVLKGFATTPDGVGSRLDAVEAIEQATGRSRDDLANAWHASIRETYGVSPRPREAGRQAEPPREMAGSLVIGRRTGSGEVNVGPALSPDGTRVVFLSERDRLSIDFYLADATNGRIVRKLIDTAADPHFESLQFLASAGSWDPKGERLAMATVRSGRPVLAVIDASDGDVLQEVRFPDLGEIFQPSWSPDGNVIAFSAQVGGFTDLFVHDLTSGQTSRLTNDMFADLQPVWSPDGKTIAFVTDRFSTDLKTLAYGDSTIGMITVSTRAIVPLDTGIPGNAVNPQFSGDGRALFFVSDAAGRRNAWRLDLASRQAVRITSEATGVAGITPMSPSLSVAAAAPKAAVSVFRDGGYEIKLIDTQAPPPSETGPIARVPDAAVLPPVSRTSNTINTLLRQATTGLPASGEFPERQYSPRLSLVGIGQEVGVATSSFGTYVSGGVALQFSDILGNHLVGTSFGVNGGVRDTFFGASYLNRTSRWNWGVFGERVPLVSGSVATGFVDIGGDTLFVEETDLFRQTYSQAGMVVAYPFSRVSRVEFSGGTRHIGFDREVRTRIFDPVTGQLLSDDRERLPASPSLTLYDASAAFVRDTAAFGATSPVVGQRMRFDVGPTFGELELVNVTADFRQYVMPVRPVTFAGRVLHIGRYGGSGEDERLMPLFLGYSTLVRGWDVSSFEFSDCTPMADGSCPEFDRLLGSRILVVNLEARAPLVGLFRGRLDYGPLPVELFTFFDSGTAWTKATRPTFADGTRPWVSSIGFGARVNLLGFAIGEFNAVRPLNRLGRNWMFVFNLRPGF
jgi:hypothetical protein